MGTNMLINIVSLCLVSALVSGAQYPAGVSPAACPNYPDCSLTPAGYAGAVSAYPAGVVPGTCPDYPYCSGAGAVPAGYTNTAGLSALTIPTADYNHPRHEIHVGSCYIQKIVHQH